MSVKNGPSFRLLDGDDAAATTLGLRWKAAKSLHEAQISAHAAENNILSSSALNQKMPQQVLFQPSYLTGLHRGKAFAPPPENMIKLLNLTATFASDTHTE